MTWRHHLLLDDLEHDLRQTPADEDVINPTLGNVTTMDTASDASGVQRQVSTRRGRRLRILGTEPTVEDLRSTNRFSLLEDDSDAPTVSEVGEGTTSESETESLPDPEYMVEERRPVPAIVFASRGDYRAAFTSLDVLELNSMFEGRANIMRSVPFVMRGAFRGALRIAMNEAVLPREQNDVFREERAWKLFFLLPRILLTRPPRGGKIPPKQLEGRMQRFSEGRWLELLAESEEACRIARTAAVRKRRRGSDQDRKVARAESLVMVGELSSARQVLESADLAPGNLSTLRALTDPEKRPPLPRDPPPPELMARMPDSPFQLDEDKLAQNIRKARRGAAPGPSGMTNEHLFTLLESEDDLSLFSQFAGILARGDIPPNALEVIRRGRMSALRKANGGVRGIVVGDTLRRLVARTIAQQIGDAVERATSPF